MIDEKVLIERLEELYDRNDKMKKEAYEEQDWEKFDLFMHRSEGVYSAIKIVNQLAQESANVHVVDDLAVIESLPSLYPLQAFEEEAIHRVVGNANNNGWIPCSERLPEEQKCKDGHIDPSEEVLVYIYYSENCVSNGCGVSRYWNSSKHHENPWIDLKYGKDNVIAWQPLPAPYQPKGE